MRQTRTLTRLENRIAEMDDQIVRIKRHRAKAIALHNRLTFVPTYDHKVALFEDLHRKIAAKQERQAYLQSVAQRYKPEPIRMSQPSKAKLKRDSAIAHECWERMTLIGRGRRSAGGTA